MPGRHVAPRHKAPSSAKRSLSRAAQSTTGALVRPRATATLALLGAATAVTGLGVYTAQPGNAERDSSAVGRSSGGAASAGLADHATPPDEISRSGARPPTVAVQRATKSRALSVTKQAQSGAVTETVAPSDPREIAMSMLPSYGWDSGEFTCLDQLWVSESGWNPYAENSSSGAYGIPQSLPAEKMATAGADWQTNPATQIEWGLTYIRDSYGTPCGAWNFKLSNNWY